ncbi:hypothetical protein AWZ03_011364 [Drosophila navojoa]|uniref:Uncharacterized protein n=2 Tax=Drosophila navojoa TaxID=7232 RepID=A0A484B0E4_DRONA|nr:hypothetical protein AWZ03_011364 [Drosophila navojoa]
MKYTNTVASRVAGDYPKDLIDMARTKLGFKRIDQLPTLNNLGSLLGTRNDDETIKYVRSLTSTDQGIALMKAYLESTDYEPTNSNNDSGDKTEANDNNNTDFDVDYDTTPSRPDTTVTMKTPTPQMEAGSLMKGVNEFINQYKLWPDRLPYKHVLVGPVHPSSNQKQSLAPALQPVLLRNSLPYHYPIPLRPVLSPRPNTTKQTPDPVSNNVNTSKSATDLGAPHLSTPKRTSALVTPHVHELARIANISPDILDSFLQQQPKLAELAKRFSRLPLVQQQRKVVDSQLFMAVKRALAQENLKRLLRASQA